MAGAEAISGLPLPEHNGAGPLGMKRPPTHPSPPLACVSVGPGKQGWAVRKGLNPQLDTQLVPLTVEQQRAELALGKVGCQHIFAQI